MVTTFSDLPELSIRFAAGLKDSQMQRLKADFERALLYAAHISPLWDCHRSHDDAARWHSRSTGALRAQSGPGRFGLGALPTLLCWVYTYT